MSTKEHVRLLEDIDEALAGRSAAHGEPSKASFIDEPEAILKPAFEALRDTLGYSSEAGLYDVLSMANVRIKRQSQAGSAEQSEREALAIWDAALAHAAMYVEHHCVDGEAHADAIMNLARPNFAALQSAERKQEAAPDLLSVLREVRHALQFANDTPNGPISDTIWMIDRPETLFDFIDAALEAAAPSTAQTLPSGKSSDE